VSFLAKVGVAGSNPVVRFRGGICPESHDWDPSIVREWSVSCDQGQSDRLATAELHGLSAVRCACGLLYHVAQVLTRISVLTITRSPVQDVLLLRHHSQAPRPPATKQRRGNSFAGIVLAELLDGDAEYADGHTTATHKTHLGSSFTRGPQTGRNST
jgi:hypothetical protein